MKNLQAIGWQVQILPTAALVAANGDKLGSVAKLLSLAYYHLAGATS